MSEQPGTNLHPGSTVEVPLDLDVELAWVASRELRRGLRHEDLVLIGRQCGRRALTAVPIDDPNDTVGAIALDHDIVAARNECDELVWRFHFATDQLFRR